MSNYDKLLKSNAFIESQIKRIQTELNAGKVSIFGTTYYFTDSEIYSNSSVNIDIPDHIMLDLELAIKSIHEHLEHIQSNNTRKIKAINELLN